MNKSEQGITILALVITIIVLLILAGISIGAITGNNGLIGQAQSAKEETEIAQWEERIDTSIIQTEGDKRNPSMDDIIQGLIEKDIIDNASQVNKQTGVITTNEPSYDISGKLDDYIPFGPGIVAEKNEEYKDENGDIATIPKGFEILPEADTVNEGLVIQDEVGNQFVWIPVDDYSKFVRQAGYGDGTPQSWPSDDYGETDSTGINNKLKETQTTKEEAIAMYKSVKNHGGFYIGRFETGKDESGKAVIRKGVTPYNNVPWSVTKSMTEDEEIDGTENGAIEQARYFDTANKYTSVTSTLCYSVQWDAIMNFIDPNYITNAEIGTPNCVEDSYIRDSSGKGWHDQDDVTNTGYYEVNHIYDLAGNVREWTMECYGPANRGIRGGEYLYSGSKMPSSYRSGWSATTFSPRVGFRITLYIN